ncbi:MAG TPA: DCC1-like thiol-disulfide oxidoreductase family protein [Vicinamibacterales bacterium]|nr:DCC1-like thiol-disulfide oxidoreductase family protein [Vicinamibacterales bacterium]
MDSRRHGIVLYDGTCLFCHASMRFIADRDPAGYFRFGALQDPRVRDILDRHNLTGIVASSMVLIENDRPYLRSTAGLRIARRLSFPWSLAGIFLLVPRPIRDVVYAAFAALRARIAGTTDSCDIPSDAIRQRLI